MYSDLRCSTASLHLPVRRINENPHHLSEVLPEQIINKYRSMLTGLPDKVILVDSKSAVSTSGAVNIVHIADFCFGVHGEKVITARAFKWNVAHC